MHGKGIYIYKYGGMRIGYFKNGRTAPGKFIQTYKDGEFEVGEVYMNDNNVKCWKGLIYNKGNKNKIPFDKIIPTNN